MRSTLVIALFLAMARTAGAAQPYPPYPSPPPPAAYTPAPPPYPPPHIYGPAPAYYPVPPTVVAPPPPLSPILRGLYAPFYAAGLVLRYGFYYAIVAPIEVFSRTVAYGVEGGVEPPPRREGSGSG